jgi:hypothetical protein
MAAAVQAQTVHLETHRMEAQSVISNQLHRALQETAYQIPAAVALVQFQVTVALVVQA